MARIDAKRENRLLKAFEVLDDATFAITKWAWGPVEEGAESRILYSAATSLLRAVGHVRHKVDCKNFPEISADVSKRYKRWKLGENDDQIFTGFIELERNLILKEYSPSWTPKNEKPVYFKSLGSKEIEDCLNSPDGFEVAFESAARKQRAVLAFNAIQMPDGPFAGYFFDELLFEAAKWWHCELSEIERLVNRK